MNSIETLVQARKVSCVRRSIKSWLKQQRNSMQAKLQCADWLRRIGQFNEALKVLGDCEDYKPAPTSSNEVSMLRQRRIMVAQLLQQIGAHKYSQQLLVNLKLVGVSDFRIAGNISLSNYAWTDAIRYFTNMMSLDQSPTSYQTRLAKISLADAHAGMKQYELAQGLVNEVIKASHEVLLGAICLQAKGEYYAMAGSYEKAKVYLEQALKKFPETENSIDAGFLFKWLGFVYGKLSNYEKAQSYFNQAIVLLQIPALKPEIWLEVHLFKYQFGMTTLAEEKRMACYPGLSDHLYRRITRALIYRPKPIFKGIRHRIIIFLGSNEYIINLNSHPTLPLELKLLAWVRVTESWGLNSQRAKELLWPDEAFSYMQLDARLHQLLHRIRKKYAINICLDQGLLSGGELLQSLVSVDINANSEPLFFQKTKMIEFTRQDFCDFYDLSKSQATLILRDWSHRRIVALRVAGNKSYYIKQCK